MKNLVLLVLMLAMPTWAFAETTVPSAPIFNMNQGHAACAGVTRDTPSTPECEALMASRPAPSFERVPLDYGLVAGVQLIRYSKGTVNVYDAPGGNKIETISTGYQYVAPISFADGWAQISEGRWVSMADANTASPSTFSGVLLPGLDMPFAWVLWGHDAMKSPNGVSDRENGRYERYQMVWIFATVRVGSLNFHLVGPGHWINQKNLSIVYPGAPTSFDGNWVAVDLYEQNLVAYVGGAPVMATLVSSGVKNGLWNTRAGTFNVGVRLETSQMSGAEGQPDEYSLDAVPYAQYFDGLISLHGTYWHDSFGFPHSHGCVNLSIADSKWLYGFLGEGSVVHVYDRREF